MNAPRPAHRRRQETTDVSRPPRDAAALMAVLASWLPDQRWFAGGEAAGLAVRLHRRETLTTTESGASVEQVLLEAPSDSGTVIYQLFVGWHNSVPERLTHAVIGAVGGLTCFEALRDQEFSHLLLAGLADGATLGPLTAIPEPDATIDRSAHGLVSTAEQSNTSIIFGTSVILKVFRRLEPGTNPDVELLRLLHAAGCRHSATPIGEWTTPLGGTATTSALATRYYANSADGWAMATASVRDLMAEGDLHADEVGGDFAAESTRLGEAVALVHRALADQVQPTSLSPDGVRHLLAEMTAHAEALGAEVPSLTAHLPAIRQTFASIADAVGLPLFLQRIHGDLHLGQTLRTLGGWVLIDFEGEPVRPLATRSRQQSPLIDIAGMLRSFDYAAHQGFVHAESDAQRAYRADEWVRRNQDAFLGGYAAVARIDPRATPDGVALLRAFQLAKAVYEVGYEHRHRPGWETIPLAAIATLANAG